MSVLGNWSTGLFDERSRMKIRWLFLRGLAVTVFLAILSLKVQLGGLVGPEGILPIIEGLEGSSYASTLRGFLAYPTLAWWMGSFQGLVILCWVGMGLCVLLFCDVFPRLVLLLLWLVYLSLFVAGQQFTSYQWDLLVTETLFCSIFFAPGNVWPGGSRGEPSGWSVLLMRVLLFKLMFLGGAAKLLSGDGTWWDLTALEYHFETQPLPTAPAWYADKLPDPLLKAGVLFTFLAEIVLPFFVFLGRRLRLGSVLMMVSFQVLVIVTGNYGVFNLLAILLCLPVLEDRDVEWVPEIIHGVMPEPGSSGGGLIRHRMTETVLVVFVLMMNVFVFAASFDVRLARGPLRPIWQSLRRFRTVNGYGLFADMTTVRREILIQGSRNGRTWKPYDFSYKPDDISERPAFVAPHMPRLDWQMWFAALKPPGRVRWFPHFLKRLLQGSKPVLALLDENPFDRRPPRYVRAIMYRYQFSDWGSDRWWTRGKKRLYYPPVTLRNGRLKRVGASSR